MNFFRKLFGKKTEHTEQSLKEIYLQFAQIISSDDEAVLSQVHDLFDDTTAFLARHREQYLERGIDIEQSSKEELYWISFADILIAHNYAVEFDWKGELEDFEYFLKDLQGFKSYSDIEFPLLDEDGTVHLWIEQINDHWQDQSIALMQQDIDSDSHVIFVVEKAQMSFLQAESQKLGQRFY